METTCWSSRSTKAFKSDQNKIVKANSKCDNVVWAEWSSSKHSLPIPVPKYSGYSPKTRKDWLETPWANSRMQNHLSNLWGAQGVEKTPRNPHSSGLCMAWLELPYRKVMWLKKLHLFVIKVWWYHWSSTLWSYMVAAAQRPEKTISFLCYYQKRLIRWWSDGRAINLRCGVLQKKEKRQVRMQPSPNLNKKWNISQFRSAVPRNSSCSRGRFKKHGQTVWIADFSSLWIGEEEEEVE